MKIEWLVAGVAAKPVQRKTGARSQAQVVRLLVTLAAGGPLREV
jgi:hypothetical protein